VFHTFFNFDFNIRLQEAHADQNGRNKIKSLGFVPSCRASESLPHAPDTAEKHVELIDGNTLRNLNIGNNVLVEHFLNVLPSNIDVYRSPDLSGLPFPFRSNASFSWAHLLILAVLVIRLACAAGALKDSGAL
jgi:hypothetical protein